MSIERLSGQGYAPIPQCMSNTDTEEEDEHISIPTNNVNDESDKMNDNPGTQENGWCHSTNDVRILGKHPADGQGGYRYCGDNVPIMVAEVETQDEFWKRRDMSLLRRFCLILSIMLCFTTVLVFLYVLPCDNTAICPSVVEDEPAVTWDKTLEGIELHGPITIVQGNPYNLIFLLRGQHFGGNDTQTLTSQQIPSDGGGVLSMQGNSGIPLWWVPQKRLPTDMDCNSFDSDGSGTPDCIVVGEQGLLISIDPIPGTVQWSGHISTYAKLPLHIPDIDSDGIDEMLSIGIAKDSNTVIVILSGKSGKLMGKYPIHDCTDVRLNRVESNNVVSYFCVDIHTKQTLKNTVALKDLLDTVNLSQVKRNVILSAGVITRDNKNAIDESDDSSAWKLTPYYQLNIQNLGSCPGEDCRATVNVTLQKLKSDYRSIWNYSCTHCYAMKPAIYSIGEKPYVTGFAIKFWQWSDEKEKSRGNNIIERRLTERVLMVFVNYTDVHVINASQNEIIQLCDEKVCQPSLKLQTRSIAIADLTGDGTWELINYQSSYNTEPTTVLTSRVQIVKLDTVVLQLSQTSTI